jgi:hypothetical protein
MTAIRTFWHHLPSFGVIWRHLPSLGLSGCCTFVSEILRERGRSLGMAMAKRAAARRDNIQKTAIKECPFRTAPHLYNN